MLPGLDTDLDDAAWELIGEAKDGDARGAAAGVGHPQFAMHALLRRIGIARDEVAPLGAKRHGASGWSPRRCARPPRPNAGRQRVDAIAARDAALDDVAVIEAANAEEEALAIAVALREAVETPARPPRW